MRKISSLIWLAFGVEKTTICEDDVDGVAVKEGVTLVLVESACSLARRTLSRCAIVVCCVFVTTVI